MVASNNYVERLNMDYIVKHRRVFDVFVHIAKVYPGMTANLFKKYVNYILNNNDLVHRVEDRRKQEMAECIANENIGYFIGNCDKFEERKFLFKTYPTTYHPVFGREF